MIVKPTLENKPGRPLIYDELREAVLAMQEFDPPLRWKCEHPHRACWAVYRFLQRLGVRPQHHLYIRGGELIVVKLPAK